MGNTSTSKLPHLGTVPTNEERLSPDTLGKLIRDVMGEKWVLYVEDICDVRDGYTHALFTCDGQGYMISREGICENDSAHIQYADQDTMIEMLYVNQNALMPNVSDRVPMKYDGIYHEILIHYSYVVLFCTYRKWELLKLLLDMEHT